MSVSARLGLSEGYKCLPGGLSVCPRDDAGSGGPSTQHLLPGLAVQQGVHLGEKLQAPGQLKRKRAAARRGASQLKSLLSPPRAPLCVSSPPSTRIRVVPGGLATPSSQVRPRLAPAPHHHQREPLQECRVLWG